jgi:hypothetical protein
VEEWRERVRKQAHEFIRNWARLQSIDIRDVELGLAIEQLIRLRLRHEQSIEDEKRIADSLAHLESELTATSAVGSSGGTAEQADVAQADKEKLLDELSSAIEGRKRSGQEVRDAQKRFERRFPGEYAELQVGQETVEALEEWQEAFVGASPKSKEFRKLLELSNEWVQRFGNTEDDDVRDAVIMDSQVASGTCIGIAGADGTDREEYGLCILDEASKATFTEALMPLSRSLRWVLVGDPRQLPPFVDAALRNSEVLEKRAIEVDVVRETLLARLDRLKLPDSCRALLTSQHRMITPIGDLISEVFYDGKLRSLRKEPFLLPAADWSKPIVWLSTARLPNKREVEGGFGGSYVNPAEAQEIRRLIGRIDFYARARRKSAPIDKIRIVILTGYAAQRRRIENLLAQDRAQWESVEAECHTVDAYQGREADFAIFSVTRSNPQGRPGFLQEVARINVALSRGRNGLCIVGDAKFCHDLGLASPLARVLDFISRNPETCLLQELKP